MSVITSYSIHYTKLYDAEDLLTGLDDTHFADRIKLGQVNWIGKSTGAEVDFSIKDTSEKLTVYTTRPDTLYGRITSYNVCYTKLLR